MEDSYTNPFGDATFRDLIDEAVIMHAEYGAPDVELTLYTDSYKKGERCLTEVGLDSFAPPKAFVHGMKLAHGEGQVGRMIGQATLRHRPSEGGDYWFCSSVDGESRQVYLRSEDGTVDPIDTYSPNIDESFCLFWDGAKQMALHLFNTGVLAPDDPNEDVENE